MIKKTSIILSVIVVLLFLGLFSLLFFQNVLLVSAIRHDDVKLTRFYLNLGANPNHPTPTFMVESGNNYPLIVACQKSDIDIISLLLEFGADPNVQSHGVSPLVSLLAREDENTIPDIADLLIDYGASPSLETLNDSFITRSVYHIKDESISMLLASLYLEQGIHPDSSTTSARKTALMLAVIQGYDNLSILLVQNGAEFLSLEDESGKTAYDYAVEGNRTVLIAFFVSFSDN